MTHPLIILGAGIAGLWTALHAAPRRVILLTGAPLGEGSSTGWAQGGVAAALADDDTAELHAADTVAAGAGLVDEAAAQLLASAGPWEIRDLYALGAPFEKDGEAWLLSREAAHSRARVARVKGDQAGAGILAALIAAVREAGHIEIREGWRGEALLPASDGGCAGVLARDPDGSLQRISASDTVLATGSLGGLYAVTTTPWTSHGQALAMAAQLGATVRDAEFVQFHPTAIDIGRDPAPLATEALRGEGATLIDADGNRFMVKAHADAELAPRDVVARCVHKQIQLGRGAFLDATTAVGEAFPERFPAVFAACQSAGIDPRVEPIPVAPAAHYHMGGVATDLDGFTGISGLWAVGECASTGLHGANRLASNSLLDGLVFGRRAALKLKDAAPRSVRALAASPAPELPPEALQTLRQAMARDAGVVRDGFGLSRLISTVNRMGAEFGPAHPLIAARFVIIGALARTESRGGHFRSDYPEPHLTAKSSYLTQDRVKADLNLLDAAE